MATSGDYRSYFEENGNRYSHTIDPSTGKPITHKLASVTVLHPSTMTADAMATALLVLGPERGFELAVMENLAVMFIVRDKDNFIEIMTPQFQRINNYMVEIGGEIKTRGINPDNKIWQIGIEKPLNDQRPVQTVITLKNTAMATSGDYRSYFEENGNRYSHTIDPSTGKPITHKLASVTVLHPSTMTADAMATALLVLGPERGFELAVMENLAVMFIVRDKDNFIEIMTPQFQRTIVEPE